MRVDERGRRTPPTRRPRPLCRRLRLRRQRLPARTGDRGRPARRAAARRLALHVDVRDRGRPRRGQPRQLPRRSAGRPPADALHARPHLPRGRRLLRRRARRPPLHGLARASEERAQPAPGALGRGAPVPGPLDGPGRADAAPDTALAPLGRADGPRRRPHPGGGRAREHRRHVPDRVLPHLRLRHSPRRRRRRRDPARACRRRVAAVAHPCRRSSSGPSPS